MPFTGKRMLVTGLISLAITIVFVSAGIKAFRDKALDGSINYGKAVLVGLLIVVFSSIISQIYTLIFNVVIDPDYMNRFYEGLKSWQYDLMNNMGATDSQIEDAIGRIEKQQANYSPVKFFLQNFYMPIIFGLIISLIVAAFTKKNKSPFAKQ
jgi:uncharacterized membrane protein (DUF106 family)